MKNETGNQPINIRSDETKNRKIESRFIQITKLDRAVWAILVLLTASFVSFFMQYLTNANNAIRSSPKTLEDRIEELTKSLISSAETITAIEHEIEQRRRLVDGLRRDAETAEALRQTNRQQVDAIAQVLRAEIAHDKRSLDWWDLGKNLAFTMLGFVMSEGVGWWRRRKKLYGEKKNIA